MAAGGVDIFTAAAPDGYGNAVFGEISSKGIEPFFARFGKRRPVDRIVLDDIYPDGEFTAAQFYEFSRIFGAVVETFEGDVFVGYPVFGFLVKIFQSFHQGGEVVALINGHDLVAVGIVGSVQAECQVAAETVVGQFADHFGDAGGTHSNPPGRHAQSTLG